MYITVNGKEIKTINVNGKDVEYNIETFCKQYVEKRSLPSPKIVCTSSGELITCFGTNLHNKVKAHGGIEQLLTTFVCRKAKKGGAASPELNSSTDEIETVTTGDEPSIPSTVTITMGNETIVPEIPEASEEEFKDLFSEEEDIKSGSDYVHADISEAELLGDDSLDWK